jgi:hypothetical protein
MPAVARSTCVLCRLGYTMRAFRTSNLAGEQVAFEGVDRAEEETPSSRGIDLTTSTARE